MPDHEALTVRLLLPEEPLPWDLLLEADPSRSQVQRYLEGATIVVAAKGSTVCGVLVLNGELGGTGEIANIAVDSTLRHGGIGKQLLSRAVEISRSLGMTSLDVSTGNSSLGQLAFYQKAGFRIVDVEPDYFTNHYTDAIVEHGIVCRDRIVLRMNLATTP